jgi:hypothetical protein
MQNENRMCAGMWPPALGDLDFAFPFRDPQSGGFSGA